MTMLSQSRKCNIRHCIENTDDVFKAIVKFYLIMNSPPTNCHVLSPQAARVLARYK